MGKRVREVYTVKCINYIKVQLLYRSLQVTEQEKEKARRDTLNNLVACKLCNRVQSVET